MAIDELGCFTASNETGKIQNKYLSQSISLMGDPEMPIYTDDPTPISATYKYDPLNKTNKLVVSGGVDNLVVTISDGKIIPSKQIITSNNSSITYSDYQEPYIITITGRNKVPLILEPSIYRTLYLHDCEIKGKKEYWADELIVGENVVVNSEASLTVHVKNKITMRSNVEAQDGAYVKFSYQ